MDLPIVKDEATKGYCKPRHIHISQGHRKGMGFIPTSRSRYKIRPTLKEYA